MYKIIRLVIAALVMAYTRKTHRILWQCFNRKLDRNTPVAHNAMASSFAWIIGTGIGICLWPTIGTGLQKTFWYEVGWWITVWLGGMVPLSIVELFDLWRERRNQDKSK